MKRFITIIGFIGLIFGLLYEEYAYGIGFFIIILCIDVLIITHSTKKQDISFQWAQHPARV